MALTIYRRHLKACPFFEKSRHARNNRDCKARCPIWVQGTLGGEKVWKSLNLADWSKASDLIHGWEAAGKIGFEAKKSKPVADAITEYLDDCAARHLSAESIKKYRTLLRKHVEGFCTREGLKTVDDFDLPTLRKFRKGLPFAPLTQVKAVEMTRAFFQFCVDSEWIEKNPAKKLKAPKVKDIPTLPFEEDEVKSLIDACTKWPEVSHQAGVNWKEMRALFLVLRWTGLRISDGVTLSKKKVEHARVFLRTTKTGEAVYVPVPPLVIEALAEIETDDQHYFWSGLGSVKTVIETWRRRMLKVAKIADVTGAEFHRFRDTFSVALLKRNVSVENVAILLGISPATVLKHYAPWVKSRQDALTTAVSQAWESAER